MILAANCVSCLSTLLLFLSVYASDKKKMLIYQMTSSSLGATAYYLLGGVSGLLLSVIATIRNTCLIMGLQVKWVYYIILSVTLVAGLYFNTQGWTGILPVVASVEYAVVLMFTTGFYPTKIALLVNFSLWCVYDLISMNYVGALADAVLGISSIISLRKGKPKD